MKGKLMLVRKGVVGVSVPACAVLCAALLASPPASAVPIIEFYVNGALEASYSCADPEFDCSNPSEVGFFAFLSDPEWDVSISAAFYPDPTLVPDPAPEIIYSTAVTDKLGGNTFGFIFLQDVVPVVGTLDHNNSSSTTDGAFNGVPVTPAAAPLGIPPDSDGIAEIAVFTVSTNGGTSYLSSGLDLRAAFVGAGGPGSDTQPGLSESGPGPGGTINQMRVDVNFALAGGDDSYTAGGETSIVVPEPISLSLLGLGLAWLGYAGRRRSA